MIPNVANPAFTQALTGSIRQVAQSLVMSLLQVIYQYRAAVGIQLIHNGH
jgi:hypothetical protein